MGLLLRPDAYYAETPDGAHILSHEGEINLTGRSVYQLVDRLAPYLNGAHSLAELTADLSPERRDLVERLIGKLLECSIVRDAGPDGAPEPETDECAYELAFSGYFQVSAQTVLAGYRDKAILVIGAGRLCRAVVHALRRSGARDVGVVLTAEAPTDLGGTGAAAGDGHGELRRDGRLEGDLGTEAARGALSSFLDGADLVLHVSDRPMVERALLLDRLCEQAGTPLAHALVVGGEAWIACAGVGDRAATSWTSGWRRRLARRPDQAGPPGQAGPPEGVSPDQVLEEHAATVVASQFVHEVFRSVTRCAEPRPNQVTCVDLSSLSSEACVFVPHPLAMAAVPTAEDEDDRAQALAGRIAALGAGPRIEEKAFSERAVVCADDRLGVIGRPSEGAFTQLPLHVCEIAVSDPVGLLGSGALPVTTIGAGLDFETARLRAALKAFAAYGSLMVDPRRLELTGDLPAGAHPDVMLSELRIGRLDGAVHGHGLADGAPRRIDATRVFPALRAPASRYAAPYASPYAPPPGVAAGYDWDGAVVRGLLDHCSRLTMDELMTSARPFPRVSPAEFALDARGERYRALLAAVGKPVTVYDITGSLGVPTLLGYLGSEPVACASSVSAAGALTDALEQVLLHQQARENNEPAYAPAPVRDIPEDRRGTIAPPPAGEPPLDGAAIAAALAKQGRRPIVVPLDHDSEVTAVMPYIVHVLIER